MVKDLQRKNIKHKHVFIIAEAGVNHNGSISIAKKMIDIAAEAKVDAIKFQSFKTEELICKYAPRAEYQKKTTFRNETQFEMLKKLELGVEAHKVLLRYCRRKKIKFLSSPFDLESVILLDKLGVEIFKIPSGEINNLPYLRKVGSLHKKIILSTGMSGLKEIKDALHILLKEGTPKKNITILHCNTEYPTPFSDVNLLAMLTLKNIFKVNVGYSDHTTGIEVPIAAVALGADVIEKHFTLNKNMEGPDHKSSLEPNELKSMVKAIRNIEIALGKRIKQPSHSEMKNREVVRKSIVARNHVKEGEVFNEDNITVKRPSTGLSPMLWDRVIGRCAKKDFKKDEPIKL